MASDSEGVGRLLAINTLMKGDRELLRKQDEPARNNAKPTATQQQQQPAISHDSKATAAVLLKLLDDRLLASEAEITNSQQSAAGPDKSSKDDTNSTLKQVSARYTADGLPAGTDNFRPEIAFPGDQSYLRSAIPPAAPEMQTFMQRFAAFAAGRSSTINSTGGGVREPGIFSQLGGTTPVMAFVFAVFVLWLGAMIAGWFPG